MVSDATGDTVVHLTRACLAQFEDVEIVEHLWILMRTEKQIDDIVESLDLFPGAVVFTLVDPVLQERLKKGCAQKKVPCVAVLDPVINLLTLQLGKQSRNLPGKQYVIDDNYFSKIDAIDFALFHDDGQGLDTIHEADVVLVGISRTSKTPTCLYLAQHGVKAANYPLVPGNDLPPQIMNAEGPVFVGLTENADRILAIRKHRMHTMEGNQEADYVNPEKIDDELRWAKRIFAKKEWPSLDVTNRSIEETSAAVLKILVKRKMKKEKLDQATASA